MALTDQVLMPGSDYQAICDATRNLTGKTETLKSGDISTELETVTPQTETWVLKAELVIPNDHVSYPVDATMYSNNYQRDVNVVQIDMTSEHLTFFVLNDDNNWDSVNGYAYGEWYDNSYRKLVFNVPPTGDLLTWLTANGVKQPANLAVQPSKDVTVTSNGMTEITPEAPYDGMTKVRVTIPTVDQATPSISVNADGLITASATQSAGYVTAGTKSATQQLTTQSAKTVTPSNSSQTAVSSGVYTTGAVTVAAVPTEMKVADLSMASGNQVISNTSGKYMTSVTVKKPDTLVEKNVRYGCGIGGVFGTYSPHVCVFPELISVIALLDNAATTTYDVEFWYGDNEYCTAIRATPQKVLYYYNKGNEAWYEVYKNNQWLAEAYRKIVLTEYKSNVETALRKVGYIQENQAVDPNAIQKTYTSNGVYSILPDAPYYNGISEVQIQVAVSSGVDLPFTKLTTVSTDNGILSFSFTGYYDTIIAKRSGTNKVLTAVFGNGLKASFGIESEGSVLSTSAGFSYNQVGNKFNITWNISNSSGSVWYEGSYDIYGCNNG